MNNIFGSVSKPMPYSSFSEQYQAGSSVYGNILANELFEKYKMKLTSWGYTQPIQNSFAGKKK